jgi:hypothetical protein
MADAELIDRDGHHLRCIRNKGIGAGRPAFALEVEKAAGGFS